MLFIQYEVFFFEGKGSAVKLQYQIEIGTTPKNSVDIVIMSLFFVFLFYRLYRLCFFIFLPSDFFLFFPFCFYLFLSSI